MMATTGDLSLSKFVNVSAMEENITTNISGDADGVWTVGPTANFTDLYALAKYLVQAVIAATACIGLVCNYFIFIAAWRVPSKTLKSKPFIVNSILGDAILCAARAVTITTNIAKAYLKHGPTSRLIALSLNILGAFAQYGQQMVSIPLVVDRLYAVAKPLTYYTTGYSRAGRILLVASPWVVTSAMNLPTFFILLSQPLKGKPFYLQLEFSFRQFTELCRLNVMNGVSVLVFLMYVVIFVMFVVQRKSNRAVDRSSADKTNLSLTLTYFFTYFSSLCLYLPGPVFTTIREFIPPSVMPYKMAVVVSRILVILYYINPIVNAVILGKRVPSIRSNLKQVLKIKDKAQREDQTKITQTGSQSIEKMNSQKKKQLSIH